MVKEKRLITAALPYTNNVPHLGNMVGSHYPADVFARYCRLAGYDTIFIGGTDEHGTASEIAAQQNGVSPQELCDIFYKIHKEIYEWFEISYDNFSRSSRKIHHETANEFLKMVYKNGYISEKKIKLPHCLSCKRELADRYIEGTCPKCGYENARGDQCESCGILLDPEKLLKAKCKACGSNKIEFKEISHLFLDLEKLSSKIEKWLEKNKQLRPQVKNLALAWIRDGLKPRCITRNLKWGIQVPIKGYEQFVWYVWAEAPLGYISSTKEWNKTKWKQYWTDPKAKIYHFVGKDNIPFHTIFFPGLLLAHKDINLPYNVVGVQYLNYERGKFSKSNNRGIFCENLPKIDLSPEYWRYYMAYLIPETRDTEFLWSDFQDKVNNELVANLGNFINRTITFTNKNFESQIPIPSLTSKDNKFLKDVDKQIKVILSAYEKVELRIAMDEIMKLSTMGNKYFQENEPWRDTKHANTVVYICLNLSKTLALIIQPYLPATSKKILGMLNSKESDFKTLTKQTLKPKHKINKAELLFTKLEDQKIEELKEKTSKITNYFKKEEKQTVPSTKSEAEASVPFSDWEKMKFKVGKILKVEPHPNADRLYILQVDVGEEKARQIVAGIRQHYKAEELIGKQIAVFTNLQPAVIRGVESHGMLLAADSDEKLIILSPEKTARPGCRIG
ncbi:methionine--tRNA ligase [Candidatus Woesearchaeota archaeon]|nr:methionine--tRNA ligase [Candidatus Woesearchaeota archaeon]